MPFGASTAVSPTTALTFSAVWAAMRLLSESVSTLPLNVYKKENNTRKRNCDVHATLMAKRLPMICHK